MSIIQEATFERLLSKYERAFGQEPPTAIATLDDAIAYMRDRLGFNHGHDANHVTAIPHMQKEFDRAPGSGPATRYRFEGGYR